MEIFSTVLMYGIVALGCAIGIGAIVAAKVKNPRVPVAPMVVGAAFVEALAIYVFIFSLIITGKLLN